MTRAATALRSSPSIRPNRSIPTLEARRPVAALHSFTALAVVLRTALWTVGARAAIRPVEALRTLGPFGALHAVYWLPAFQPVHSIQPFEPLVEVADVAARFRSWLASDIAFGAASLVTLRCVRLRSRRSLGALTLFRLGFLFCRLRSGCAGHARYTRCVLRRPIVGACGALRTLGWRCAARRFGAIEAGGPRRSATPRTRWRR